MDEKEINISETVKQILECSVSDELCERFNAAYSCRDEDEDLMFEDLGLNLMKAIVSNNINSVFFAFCGASAEDLLKKALFIPDDRRRSHEEYEDEEVEVEFDDGSKAEVFCKLCTDTHEIDEFEFTSEEKQKRIKKIMFEFCCAKFEVYPKSDMYDDDKWSFWYDDEKWRNYNG